MKILILVLSYDDKNIYTNFYETQKSTWDSVEIPNIETFYFFGNSDKNFITGNTIFTTTEESLENCGKKTLHAFEMIYNFEFDYLFRTNSSSYIDKLNLLSFVATQPNTNFYCGIIGNHNGINFCSGSGYFLSRDVFDLTMKHKDEWDHQFIDDVSLGKLLTSKGINLKNAKRVDLLSNNLNINNIPIDYYHYRLKTNDRYLDAKNMINIKKLKDSFYGPQ